MIDHHMLKACAPCAAQLSQAAFLYHSSDGNYGNAMSDNILKSCYASWGRLPVADNRCHIHHFDQDTMLCYPSRP